MDSRLETTFNTILSLLETAERWFFSKRKGIPNIPHIYPYQRDWVETLYFYNVLLSRKPIMVISCYKLQITLSQVYKPEILMLVSLSTRRCRRAPTRHSGHYPQLPQFRLRISHRHKLPRDNINPSFRNPPLAPYHDYRARRFTL